MYNYITRLLWVYAHNYLRVYMHMYTFVCTCLQEVCALLEYLLMYTHIILTCIVDYLGDVFLKEWTNK